MFSASQTDFQLTKSQYTTSSSQNNFLYPILILNLTFPCPINIQNTNIPTPISTQFAFKSQKIYKNKPQKCIKFLPLEVEEFMDEAGKIAQGIMSALTQAMAPSALTNTTAGDVIIEQEGKLKLRLNDYGFICSLCREGSS
jgi:hypothetical protein